MAWDVRRETRAIHATYVVFTKAVEEMIEAKLESARNPWRTWDYAEAVDAIIILLPPDVKTALTMTLRQAGIEERWATELLERVYRECMAKADPYTPAPESEARCLMEARAEVDAMAEAVIEKAHEHELFILTRDVRRGGERG